MDKSIGQDLVNLDFEFANESPVPCILCEENFEVVSDPQPMLQHLLKIHKFLIGGQEEIADFRQYVLYWQKLKFMKLQEFCIIISTNSEPGATAKQENMFLLCDKLLEDKHLRSTLKDTKLKYLTTQKEEECRNKSFSRTCIYCTEEISGGIAKSFHHLALDHGFSLGNPDNIVFGAKLLDILDEKLQNLECLYCEKIFKSHLTLREHMRKKQHRSLNPRNKSYDKFYFLNYLKPGVPWQEAKKAVLEERDHAPKELENETNSDDDNQWSDWREYWKLSATCLFCPFTTSQIPTAILHHMLDNHTFDFLNMTKDFSFYSRVKLINYIRNKIKHKSCIKCDLSFINNEDLMHHMESENHLTLPEQNCWDQQIFMIPVIENDGILLSLDDNEVQDDDTSSSASFVDDEIVFAEDQVPVDWKMLEEIYDDHNVQSYQCLFCSFKKVGTDGLTMCVSHMNAMHNFDLKSILKLDPSIRAACFRCLRHMTKMRRCFVCNKKYQNSSSLEEHRLLAGHTELAEEIVLKLLRTVKPQT